MEIKITKIVYIFALLVLLFSISLKLIDGFVGISSMLWIIGFYIIVIKD